MTVAKMANTVRDYAWGSVDLIADLRGVKPSGDKEAEVWMGAHSAAPSVVDLGDGSLGLDRAVANDPIGLLGDRVAERFGKLPYLMKLLAAAEPLSLQAHPTVAQAVDGFRRENEAGIGLDAANRSYKDDNHKPELICALTPFKALVGFRDPDASVEILEPLGVGELDPILEVLRGRPSTADLTALLRLLLNMDSESGRRLADAVAAAVEPPGHCELERSVARSISRVYPGDPGIVTALLLNTVELAPGQAVHLGAGVLHAYVQGLGVEIMASSDNVLRGGLTPKHVDVDELCAVVDPTPGPVDVLEGDADGGDFVYRTPSPEFELRRIELNGSESRSATGPEILLVTSGDVAVDGGKVEPGGSVFVAAGTEWTADGTGQLFRAVVPGF